MDDSASPAARAHETDRPPTATALTARPPHRSPLPPAPYLVVGLARSGIAAARALRRRGLPVIGLDSGDPEDANGLAETARALGDEGVEVHLGVAGTELLQRIGSVVKSPGVPDDAPAIALARRQGVPVLGELELAWRMLANELIAVTGTNGKTTTVELITHVRREAGLPVALAGNVGLALSALVDRIDGSVPIVCEASSFQLQDSVALVPEVAVLLNLAPDHLDRHGSFDAYAAAKLQAFARQREEHVAVLPAGLTLDGEPVRERIRKLGCKAQVLSFGEGEGEGEGGGGGDGAGNRGDGGEDGEGNREGAGGGDGEGNRDDGGGNREGAGEGDGRPDVEIRDGAIAWHGEPLIAVSDLRIKGAHNVSNAMAAAAVCMAIGMDRDVVAAGLASFPGVAHRLEEVRRAQGVAYVNDSKATNVASTLVALAALAGEGGPRRVHLILGGQRKGQDLAPLRDAVRASCAAAYLIGQDAPLIAEALRDCGVPVHECGELEVAVTLAAEQSVKARAAAAWVAAAKGTPRRAARGAAGAEDGASEADIDQAAQIVLLSPACASFDQFSGFEARGERFKQLVAAL